MTEETDKAIRNAANAAADLLRDLRTGGGDNTTGDEIRTLLRATASTVRSMTALVHDLQGIDRGTTTIGMEIRATLRHLRSVK